MSNRKMELIKIENGDRAHTNGETFIWNSGTAWAVVDTNNKNAIWHVSADRDEAVETLEREIELDNMIGKFQVTVGVGAGGRLAERHEIVEAEDEREAFDKVADTLQNWEQILHVGKIVGGLVC